MASFIFSIFVVVILTFFKLIDWHIWLVCEQNCLVSVITISNDIVWTQKYESYESYHQYEIMGLDCLCYRQPHTSTIFLQSFFISVYICCSEASLLLLAGELTNRSDVLYPLTFFPPLLLLPMITPRMLYKVHARRCVNTNLGISHSKLQAAPGTTV